MSSTSELRVEYYQSVTKSVEGLSKVKSGMCSELKELREHYEKQSKHLEKFQSYMSKLEKSSSTLTHTIEQKRQIDQAQHEQSTKELEQLTLKITELQELIKSNESSYKKSTYKINNSISTLQQKKVQLDEQLQELFYRKDELTQQLNLELQRVNDEKQNFRNLSADLQSKISTVQQSIRQQEEEDIMEQQMEEQLKHETQSETEQAKHIISQMNEQTKKNIANFQVAISHLDENIKIILSNIAKLNEFISGQKSQNQQLQVQLTQIQEKINIQINVLIEQRNQLTLQVQTLEVESSQQLEQLSLNYNDLISQKAHLQATYEQHEASQHHLHGQISEFEGQVTFYQEQHQSLINQFNLQFDEFNLRLAKALEQYALQRTEFQLAHSKLQSKHQEYHLVYESHLSEIPQLKLQYEQTITNINIKINETKVLISNYETTIQKHQAVAQEYRPVYYVTQKNKGKFVEKSVEGEEGDEVSDDDDDEASESDEDHFNLVVKFLTKDKIKTSKKKLKVELENGAYYLTFKGLIKKAEKDKNILMDSRKNATANCNFSYKVKLFDEIDRTANEKLTIRGNKVHKLKLSKKKGTKIVIKVKREDSGAPHEAIAVNVNYFGSYEDNGRTLVMALRGMTIDASGQISGDGSDDRGKFTVDGLLNLETNEVKFKKQYATETFEYNGKYQNKTITGRWSIGLYSGPFSITTTKKIFVYKGWYEQEGEKTDMEFILMLKSQKESIQQKVSEVVGEGTDAGGAFKWSGRIEKQGSVTLVKQYIGKHQVKYTGQQEGKKISGMWDLDGELGSFECEEVFDEEYAKKKEILNQQQKATVVQTHKACGMNQQYYGTYLNEEGQLVVVTFTDFNIDLDGVVHGAGCDAGGKFTVFGQLDFPTNQIHFSKQYELHAVYFCGVYENNTFRGHWSYYEGSHYGEFSMSYTSRIFSYKGIFNQAGQDFETDFTLMYKLNNQVDGVGYDEIGQYNWSGTVEREGKVNLVKQYVGKHQVRYVGEVKGGKFSGTWSLGETTGAFNFEEVSVDREVKRSHKSVGSNQHYFGSYDDHGQVVVIALRGLVFTCDGEIHGQGQDAKGKYHVQGHLDLTSNNVTITKYYETSYVQFSGVYAGNSIKGRWSVYPGLYYGAFTLTNTQKIFQYKGWYEQGGQKDNMEFFLMLKSNNQVEGEGSDPVGKFKWTGTLENQGSVNLVKQYIGKHSVNYKGTVQGTKLVGQWSLESQTGGFEVEEQLL